MLGVQVEFKVDGRAGSAFVGTRSRSAVRLGVPGWLRRVLLPGPGALTLGALTLGALTLGAPTLGAPTLGALTLRGGFARTRTRDRRLHRQRSRSGPGTRLTGRKRIPLPDLAQRLGDGTQD